MQGDRKQLDKLKKAYNKQVATPDAMAAWDRFETKLDQKSRRKVFLLPMLLLLLFVLLGVLWNVDSKKDIQENTPKVEEMAQNSKISPTLNVENKRSEVGIQDKNADAGDIGNAKFQTPITTSSAKERFSESKNELSGETIKYAEDEAPETPINDSAINTIDKGQIDTPISQRVQVNPAFMLERAVSYIEIQTYEFTEIQSWVDIKISEDLSKEIIEEPKDREKFSVSLGLFSGISSSKQKSIVSSTNYNLGTAAHFHIGPRFFTSLGASYTNGHFKTLVNSRDLRVGSLELRAVEGKMEFIENQLNIIDISLGFHYALIANSKFEAYLGTGLSQKWATSQHIDYVITNNDQNTKVIESSNSSYKYPIYTTLGTGLKYKFQNSWQVGLSMEYQKILHETELNHPAYIGAQLGLFIKL